MGKNNKTVKNGLFWMAENIGQKKRKKIFKKIENIKIGKNLKKYGWKSIKKFGKKGKQAGTAIH